MAMLARHLVRTFPRAHQLWARSRLAGHRSRAYVALGQFQRGNEDLCARRYDDGVAAVRTALDLLGIDHQSWPGRAALSAAGASAYVEVTGENVASGIQHLSSIELEVLCRGFAFLGLFRASLVARSMVREKVLRAQNVGTPEDVLRLAAALIDVGNPVAAGEVLDRDERILRSERRLMSLALACGYGSERLWANWAPAPETANLVAGSRVVLRGPMEPATPSVDQPEVSVSFKFLGRKLSEESDSCPTISVINGHAYSELARRFLLGCETYTMSPCRLLLYKNKSAPKVAIDAKTARLQARPETLIEKANMGLMTTAEMLLSGAREVAITGFDLWTSSRTAHPSYKFYSSDNSTAPQGGLDRPSVARSAGIHEPVSQLNYLKSLMRLGRISPDTTLRGVLQMSEEEYVTILEKLHGVPFAR